MGRHAHIEPGGYVTIDTAAWLALRTAGTLDDLTGELLAWAETHLDNGEARPPDEPTSTHGTQRDWAAITGHWLIERGACDEPEPVLITHTETRLDAEVWIQLATLPEHGRIAVVGVNHDDPVVHVDNNSDPWEWLQADTVEISCPTGHLWTWCTGRELVTADLRFTTITAVFGPDLDAPFTPAPDGEPTATPWIRCPTCAEPCDVELPAY